MKQVKTALIRLLLKHSRCYYKGQEIDVSPEIKAMILKHVWKTVTSELRQEFTTSKY